ncbi:uncharacterized protein LOC127160358 isoform X5 [Labeo rohita]|uniref:uncharacterized protein LOC127160358 isoform X5 n=1 Tax=Labeo rohita TaxID=84645 RepID=UPI0021E31F89|nr:uncharacterized protein LOC127160358 isoform X5 [Labeo rohita]
MELLVFIVFQLLMEVQSDSSTSNTTEQTTTTAMKTSLPSKTNLPISTPKETIMLVFIGVAVILAGLMGLICLCHFTRLKHPESHQDNKTDPTDTRSVITSINPIYQPSDVNDVNKQQKQGNTEENELLIEFQSYKFPTVHVSLDVIRESNSVLISRSVFGLEIRVHL